MLLDYFCTDVFNSISGACVCAYLYILFWISFRIVLIGKIGQYTDVYFYIVRTNVSYLMWIGQF